MAVDPRMRIALRLPGGRVGPWACWGKSVIDPMIRSGCPIVAQVRVACREVPLRVSLAILKHRRPMATG